MIKTERAKGERPRTPGPKAGCAREGEKTGKSHMWEVTTMMDRNGRAAAGGRWRGKAFGRHDGHAERPGARASRRCPGEDGV